MPVSTQIFTYQESVGIEVVKRVDIFTPNPSPDSPSPSPKGLYLRYVANFFDFLCVRYMRHLWLG